MKKKHFINPNTLKLVSSIFITLSISTLCLLLTNSVMKELVATAKNSYRHLLNTNLNSYSQMIKIRLENYQSYLDFICDSEVFENTNGNEIEKYLERRKSSMPEDFTDLFYVDEDLNIFCTSGNRNSVINMPNFIDDYNLDKNKYYVSNGYQSGKNSNEKLFFLGRPVYADTGKLLGSLGASININILEKIIKQLNSIHNDSLIIIDADGSFLYHADKNWLLKNYEPAEKQFEGITSKYVSNIANGEIETIDVNGNQILLSFKKIENTKWTVGLTTPKNKIDSLQKKQGTYKLYILFIALLVILFFVSVENILIKTFQQKELMVTVYDPLTNVWTRQKFENEAKKMIIKHPFTKFMLVETDIRGFKFINQNFGELEADKLLKYVSQILTKESIFYHSIMGRGFADHFYTFLRVSSVRNAMIEFKAFNSRINETIKQYEIPFQLKFGISFLLSSRKNKDTTVQTLIGQASFAKGTIKDDMVTDYAIYNSRLLKKINEERFLENNMEKALQNHEFFIMYQPKISLSSDKIVGAEALVRWRNSELGLLSPAAFIELFERNGFIKKLDFYVYEEVFKFIKSQAEGGNNLVPISINMSRSHSKPDKFVHDFKKIFKKYSIDPSLVEIEILERSVMDNNTLKEITELLHKDGFTVAMDDFGSGESSLNMLTKIPVDVLKFDRTFLLSSSDDNGIIDLNSSNIIATLIELGHTLNKKIIFEGVETESQRDFLKSVKCDQVQGFFYSKPLSEADFIEFIKTHS